MMLRIKKIILVKLAAVVACVLLGGTSWADLAGSKHDFSSASWNTSGEVCLPCHTPHNANSQNSTPLWNHSTTQQTFTMYPYAGPLRESSKICLSCHDGTVALDSFGGNNGTYLMSGPAVVGTDLSDDHPVSIRWIHQTLLLPNGNISPSVSCTNCHDTHQWGTSPGGDLSFFNGYVECASCHDVHNGTPHEKMLRLPTQNGQLCLHCHAR